MTGYPVAFAIGVKNAAFELAKMPFSLVGGLIAGRDYFWEYPLQNMKTAWNTLEFETTTMPSHGLLTSSATNSRQDDCNVRVGAGCMKGR